MRSLQPRLNTGEINPLILGNCHQNCSRLVLLALVATLASKFMGEGKDLPSRQAQASNQTGNLLNADPFAKNPTP